MTKWSASDVHAALGVADDRGPAAFAGIVTDSRAVEPGSLFVALTGEHFDGHRFLADARDAGATAAIVRRGTPEVPGLCLFQVDEPLEAYGTLARLRRRTVTGPVVGVTGTNGKTSTKELIAAALGTRYRTHATRMNLNNRVGVPLTILGAPGDTEALVVEAGANQLGEIAACRRIIEPTIGVITNVAAGHLDGFGSEARALAEKVELVRGAPVAVVGVEPPDLAIAARRVASRVVTAGLAGADVIPGRVDLGSDGRATLEVDGERITLRIVGRHQASNAMVAWAVARELGLEAAPVARALERCSIPPGRAELVQRGGFTILNDSYNANPASFRAVLDVTRRLREGRRLVFVAGEMRELAQQSVERHREVAGWLADLDADVLAAVGAFGPALESHRDRLGPRLIVAPDAEALAPLLAERLEGTELVVLKGSRGEALERLLPTFARSTDTPA